MDYFDNNWNKTSVVLPEKIQTERDLFPIRYRLAINAGTLAMITDCKYVRAKLLGKDEWVWLSNDGGLVVPDESVYAWQVAETNLPIK